MTSQNRPDQKVETGLDFTGRCLNKINLSERLILNSTFDGASLRRANLSGAEFRECSFVGADLDTAILRRTVFENCDFTRAAVTNANLQDATFRSTTILSYEPGQPKLRPSNNRFDGAVLDGSSFRRARLVAMKLHEVKARNVDFSNCDLRGASFDGASLKDVNFFGAQLLDADFSKCPEAHSSLPDYAKLVVKLVQPISTARLEEVLAAHLRWLASNGQEGQRLNMRGMDLAGRNLDGYDFSGTDFRGARLDRASMKDVKLVAADLRLASLINTNFTGSDLRGAFLSKGALKRAVLVDASYDAVPLATPSPDPVHVPAPGHP
jgi:uncharacterized protein YjbI with pentapeptide repeats